MLVYDIVNSLDWSVYFIKGESGAYIMSAKISSYCKGYADEIVEMVKTFVML